MPKPLSRVSLGRCPNYDSALLFSVVHEILSTLEPFPLSPGARILLKPNCLSSHYGPDRPVNTRSEVVEAVGSYLRTHHQVNLYIADSGGMGSYGKAKRAYALMGLDRVADMLEAQIVNLEDLGLIEIESPTGRILPRFKATAFLDQIDGIINLPKLKTHILTALTGATKNFLGLLPGSLKRAVHVSAPSGRAMSQALVDILAGVTSKVPLIVNVMDGIMAMEGAGPSHGRLKETGWLLASVDPVALDCVAAAIMGFRPSKVPIIKAAEEAGLGNGDPLRIELLGARWEELALPGFQHPFTRGREWIERIVPHAWLGQAIDWVYEAKPRIQVKQCQQCHLCVQACPAQALTMTGQGLHLETGLCIECYCCLEHCPHEGLWVPRGILDRLRGRR